MRRRSSGIEGRGAGDRVGAQRQPAAASVSEQQVTHGATATQALRRHRRRLAVDVEIAALPESAQTIVGRAMIGMTNQQFQQLRSHRFSILPMCWLRGCELLCFLLPTTSQPNTALTSARGRRHSRLGRLDHASSRRNASSFSGTSGSRAHSVLSCARCCSREAQIEGDVERGDPALRV